MKNNTNSYLFGVLLLLLTIASCKKEDNNPPNQINTNDANALTEVLIIPNSNLIDGDAPSPTNTGNEPDIIVYDSTLSYSSGSQVKLPIEYIDISNSGISGIYVQVNGADSYFDVSSPTNIVNGTLLLPISLPDNLADGQFCFTFCVYDANGNISASAQVCVTVTPKYTCNTDRESGGEGRTSTTHTMGSQAGWVQIDYETYTLPDRIDVFYDGEWVGGTGNDPGPIGSVPPLATCDNPTDGYVGDNNTLFFPYDPSISQEVEVVVSGCTRSTTAWNYSITCFVEEPITESYIEIEGIKYIASNSANYFAERLNDNTQFEALCGNGYDYTIVYEGNDINIEDESNYSVRFLCNHILTDGEVLNSVTFSDSYDSQNDCINLSNDEYVLSISSSAGYPLDTYKYEDMSTDFNGDEVTVTLVNNKTIIKFTDVRFKLQDSSTTLVSGQLIIEN